MKPSYDTIMIEGGRRKSRFAGFRWWLFNRLSVLGWWVCPEPHKTVLTSTMESWDDLAPKIREKYLSEMDV